MIKILFDSKSRQAVRHKEDGRLEEIKKALESRGDLMEIGDLTPHKLDDVHVLVISGRSDKKLFNETELDIIKKFFNCGGGLFLMANHGRSRKPIGFLKPQNQIAKAMKLPVRFRDEWIEKKGELQHLELNDSHPISKNCDGLAIRTSCAMKLRESTAITVLVSNKDPIVGPVAAAIESTGTNGRAVVITSAGHIASPDDSKRTLFLEASNRTWTINAIRWLARELPDSR